MGDWVEVQNPLFLQPSKASAGLMARELVLDVRGNPRKVFKAIEKHPSDQKREVSFARDQELVRVTAGCFFFLIQSDL